MKSRKKVSRKKTARRKTSMRRNSKRMKSGRQRFRRIKRGGTIPARVIQQLRTFMVHNILPIVTQARPNIHLGHDPQPADSSITNVNDRFRQTFADIKFEDGDIIESIRNFVEEVKNPVKSADKSSTLMGKYKMLMKKLNEEEKKQLDEQTKGMMVVGKAFRPPPTARLVAADAASDAGVGAGAAGGLSPMASFIPRNMVNEPFSSPNITSHPYYSTETGTPDKLPSKHEITPYGATIYSHESDTEQPGDASRILFGTETPVSSPPPPDFIKNKENQNPQLLSPGPSPAMKLVFGSP